MNWQERLKQWWAEKLPFWAQELLSILLVTVVIGACLAFLYMLLMPFLKLLG